MAFLKAHLFSNFRKILIYPLHPWWSIRRYLQFYPRGHSAKYWFSEAGRTSYTYRENAYSVVLSFVSPDRCACGKILSYAPLICLRHSDLAGSNQRRSYGPLTAQASRASDDEQYLLQHSSYTSGSQCTFLDNRIMRYITDIARNRRSLAASSSGLCVDFKVDSVAAFAGKHISQIGKTPSGGNCLVNRRDPQLNRSARSCNLIGVAPGNRQLAWRDASVRMHARSWCLGVAIASHVKDYSSLHVVSPNVESSCLFTRFYMALKPLLPKYSGVCR